MAKVSLAYRLSNTLFEDKDLDSIIKDLEGMLSLATNVKKGKEHIESEYSGIQIYFAKPQETEPLEYGLYFKGENEKDLSDALSDFMEICGTPYFIRGRYDLVEKTLQQHGKTLKRKLEGCFAGKHVVDKK